MMKEFLPLRAPDGALMLIVNHVITLEIFSPIH